MKDELSSAIQMLKLVDNILIVSHVNPDGDTLGSALALCFSLRKLGKRVIVLKDPTMAERYEFLFEGYFDIDIAPEFFVSVDVPGDKSLPKGINKIDLCIDHHKVNTVSAQHKLIIWNVSAAGEIIFELIKELGIELDNCIATCLYTSIATDTGCFRYQNTTSQTHLIAAELMDVGIDTAGINKRMFELESLSEFELRKQVMAGIKLYFGGKVAMTTMTLKMLKDLNLTESQANRGLASEAIRIEGVQIGVLLKEREEGVKVSLRTLDYDASEIAKLWGGGGHAKASGCLIEKPLLAAEKEVIEQLKMLGLKDE